jgi:hypothetical protein
MEHAPETQVSSNTSPLIFNSLVNYVTPTVPFMSVASDTENAWPEGAMDIW